MITVHRLVQDESFDESFHEHYAYGQSYACGKFSKRQEENDENIPVFGIVDTNSDPSNVDFVIPANDDASKSIDIILATVCEAIKEGLEERKVEQIDNKDEEADAEEAKDAPKPRRQRVRRSAPKAEDAPAEEAPKSEE